MGGPLLTLIGAVVAVVWVGKQFRQVRSGSVLFVALVTVVQVILMLIFMFTMPRPLAD